MKNYYVVMLVIFCSIGYAQENYQGQISLMFNREKIELPIKSVTLKKENKIFISILAEQSNEKGQKIINLEWEFDKLSEKDEDLNMYDAFLLNVVNNSEDKVDELRFKMTNDDKDGKIFVRQGHKTLDLTSFAMKFNIESVSFENSSIKIKGNLSFKARDDKSETPLKSISEIEDCKFEIVI